MPGATNKRGQADGQRLMLVGAICTGYGECHVHALHTCGHSKSTWRAKRTYLVPYRYMVTKMHVYAMAGWAWQSSCSLGCAMEPWYRSSQPFVLFSLALYPLTSLTSYHVRECCLTFC